MASEVDSVAGREESEAQAMMRLVLEAVNAPTTKLPRKKRTQPARLIQSNRFGLAFPGQLCG